MRYSPPNIDLRQNWPNLVGFDWVGSHTKEDRKKNQWGKNGDEKGRKGLFSVSGVPISEGTPGRPIRWLDLQHVTLLQKHAFSTFSNPSSTINYRATRDVNGFEWSRWTTIQAIEKEQKDCNRPEANFCVEIRFHNETLKKRMQLKNWVPWISETKLIWAKVKLIVRKRKKTRLTW